MPLKAWLACRRHRRLPESPQMGRRPKRAEGNARGAGSGKERVQVGRLVRLPGSQSKRALQPARDLAAQRLQARSVQAMTEARKLQGGSQ